MVIKNKITINNNIYYVSVNVKYNKKHITKIDGSYFDCGDLEYLIKNIEGNVNDIYDNDVSMMNDILFIYDRIPFLNNVEACFYDKEGILYSTTIIDKENIENYIKENNIKMGRFNGKNSVCPCLFE